MFWRVSCAVSGRPRRENEQQNIIFFILVYPLIIIDTEFVNLKFLLKALQFIKILLWA